MKCKMFFPVIILSFLFTSFIYAQGKASYDMIGKNANEVIKTFGKPVHQDNSNPSMRCLFYKTAAEQIIFVADKNGVYQIESTEWYNSKNAAQKAFDKFISDCLAKGFTRDSIDVYNYVLRRPGSRIELSFFGDTSQNRYQVIAKANRSEN